MNYFSTFAVASSLSILGVLPALAEGTYFQDFQILEQVYLPDFSHAEPRPQVDIPSGFLSYTSQVSPMMQGPSGALTGTTGIELSDARGMLDGLGQPRPKLLY